MKTDQLTWLEKKFWSIEPLGGPWWHVHLFNAIGSTAIVVFLYLATEGRELFGAACAFWGVTNITGLKMWMVRRVMVCEGFDPDASNHPSPPTR